MAKEPNQPDKKPAPAADRTVITGHSLQVDPLNTMEQTMVSAAVTPSAEILEAGALINNNYRILALISAGGMGEVYRAENVFTGDPVAVKVILPSLARDEAVIELFRREARVLVQLRDDAIVRYHNFILDAALGRYCLIMEFVEGRHLGTRMKEEGPLDVDQAVALMRRIGSGLYVAHQRGITHRDLSPDNVILREDRISEAVLIDFGIARSTELGDGLDGRFAGKFKYIAPEQLGHADGVIGPWTDVYGLALLIAALLRGVPLPMGNAVVEASEARRQIPDLSGISHDIFPLLQFMLEPDPMRRPQDLQQVLAILDDPMRLPAQYRLPLWGSAPAAPLLGGRVVDDVTGSHSPFTSAPAAANGAAAAADPLDMPAKSRKVWPFAAAALVTVLSATGIYRGLTDTPSAPEDVEQTAASLPELPARDMTSRDGLLAEQPLPACSFASRVTTGPDSGMIAVLSPEPIEAGPMLDAYAQAFGTRPQAVVYPVSQAQCATVDFLDTLSGRAIRMPEILLQISRTETGIRLTGTLNELGGRNLWLFLVPPEGGIFDLTAQTDSTSYDSARFGAEVQARAQQDQANGGAYLLVAVASDKALTSVAAAPMGVDASQLLPQVLDEIRRNHASAAASFQRIELALP